MGGLFIPERPDVLHRQLAGAPGLVLFGARCVMVQACVICALGKPHVATCEHACHGFKIRKVPWFPPGCSPCSTWPRHQSIGLNPLPRGASCSMGGWVPWHDGEAAASMGLVALAAGRPGSPTAAVETEAAARAFEAAGRAEAADAAIENFHAAVVARLTSLYGPNGLCARSKTREQEMRVLQLLHMDNRMNMFHQAMQGSSPAVRDVWDLSSARGSRASRPYLRR